ncbi:prolyl oligopeptidase family serine peptidase [Hoeflea sp. AS60]|uniref:alpha/beta hydrolase family protein n=1 Tax=Hoeflea sp. AS60 TaxID=3135780 RepID=UPI0031733418
MKKLLVLIIASIASFLVLYALVSKDQPARHPTLNVTDLPPLIAMHDLYPASQDAGDELALGTGTKIVWEAKSGGAGEIKAQLTRPSAGPVSGPLPAVIVIKSELPSGTGPDSDRTVRFLSNRGYVVLSIDCGTIDRSHKDQGTVDPEPGRCAEATIAEDARALIDQGIADPSALAIIGSGFGGYLALMTMSLEPELFKAAIVHAAIIDLVDRRPENSLIAKTQQAVMKNDFSPAETGQHSRHAAAKSPVDLVGKIRGAILMTHGNADTVVPVEQAQAYSRELLAASNGSEVVFFDNERHCYSHWQTRVQVARLTENFLARHLGGRNGGYDYIELLAKWFWYDLREHTPPTLAGKCTPS